MGKKKRFRPVNVLYTNTVLLLAVDAIGFGQEFLVGRATDSQGTPDQSGCSKDFFKGMDMYELP